jgi:cytochrome P450
VLPVKGCAASVDPASVCVYLAATIHEERSMQAIPVLEDFDDAGFNPFMSDDAVFGALENTHERIAPLRAAAPVHEAQLLELLGERGDPNLAGKRVFTILSYRGAEQVLANPAAFSNDAELDSIGRTFGQSLTVMNAPEHASYRRIFQRIFLPGQVAKWSNDFIDPVIHGLIDRFAARGGADLVEEFTRHYPFNIIYRQLALPTRDIATFQRLAVSLTMTWGEFINYGIEASGKLGRYLAALVEQRRRAPGNDLVSLLANTEADGERLPDMVVISFLRQLLNAAGDTTYRSTGTLLAALLTSPDQFEQVKTDRNLLPQAIEEALRWDGPVLFFRRQAIRGIEIEGVRIPEAAVVEIATGAADRDPAAFNDPHRYDIHRERKRHFAFGYGPHVCLGQHLARLEMTHALTALLDRFPKLRLDPDQENPVIRGVAIRSPRHVHVRFD